MRSRLIAGTLALFVVIGAVIGFVRLGFNGLIPVTGGSGNLPTQTAVPNNPVAQENTKPGTIGWTIPLGHIATTQIQAYASATSVAPGKQIQFFVSTQVDKTPFRIDIYRLGWYGGVGGRLMFSVSDLVSQAQGYYDATVRPAKLVNCKTCTGNGSGTPVEANWKSSYTLTVPQDWVTGVYLAKFTIMPGGPPAPPGPSGSPLPYAGMQTYAPFDVLGNPNSDYVASTADTTSAAYNSWGSPADKSASLYDTAGSFAVDASQTVASKKSVVVSFNKPYLEGSGASQVLLYELQMIRFMEQRGYNVSYISSVDLHRNPEQLLRHKVYISMGHDEYWTREMRNGVEKARDSGVSLIFMGANTSYWQMRFSNNDRWIWCYKVDSKYPPTDITYANRLSIDPVYATDPTNVTALFRDKGVGRPENALIGVMFSDLTHKRLGYPWKVSSQAKTSLLKDTGLVPGQSYGCAVVGYEWDKADWPGYPAPAGLQIIGDSPTINQQGQNDHSNTTYYVAAKGNLVFATGSIYWATALDDFRSYDQLNAFKTQGDIAARVCSTGYKGVPGIEKLMENVMAAALVKHTPGKPI
ncbi:MAG: hypothetical protein IMW89_13665 [Ktedonobacteraceae bacterium]|nr:hypothetical protein [Ktedonobacteraceae bacterium]